MTVELTLATFTGLASVIAAVGAVIVSIMNNNAIRKDAKVKDEKLEEIKSDASTKDKKLEEIHILVNSRLSEALKEISTLRDSIAMLTKNPSDQALANKASQDSGQDQVRQQAALQGKIQEK